MENKFWLDTLGSLRKITAIANLQENMEYPSVSITDTDKSSIGDAFIKWNSPFLGRLCPDPFLVF